MTAGRRAALGLLLLLLLGGACRGRGPEARAEAARLKRQIAGMRALLAAASGALLSPDRLAIGIDDRLIRDLINRELPFEATVLERLRCRVLSADVTVEDGQS